MPIPTAQDLGEFTDDFGNQAHVSPPSAQGHPRMKHPLLLKVEAQVKVGTKEKIIALWKLAPMRW